MVQAMDFYRLAGGQYVERQGQPDLLGLLRQMGAVPTPGDAPERRPEGS